MKVGSAWHAEPFEVDELVARIEGLLERQERLSRKFAGKMLLVSYFNNRGRIAIMQ